MVGAVAATLAAIFIGLATYYGPFHADAENPSPDGQRFTIVASPTSGAPASSLEPLQ